MTKLRQVSESIFAASNLMYRRQVDIIPFNDVPFCLTYKPYDKRIVMYGKLLEIYHTFLTNIFANKIWYYPIAPFCELT